MIITGGCRCRAVRYKIEADTDHSTPLLVSRLPIYRCGFRHRERLLPERGGESRGRSIGLYEPRRKRQPDAPAILPHMRDACVHAERCAAPHDRRARGHARRSRDRKTADNYLDFERTKLGSIRCEHPAG